MAHLDFHLLATVLLAIFAARSSSALSGAHPGGATAAVDWAPRHEARAGNRGLLFTTLDGDLHGFNEDLTRAWRVPLGEAFIRSSAGEHAISTASEETPRLLPALDGGLFFAKGDRISYVPSTVRDMVNMSPFKVNAFPGVYITGDRQSRAHMVKVPLDGGPLKEEAMRAGGNESYESDVQESHTSDGLLAEARHDHHGRVDVNREEEGREDENLGSAAGPSIGTLEDDHHVKWSDGNHCKKLRVGMTRWRIAAVDDGTDQEQWSLTFNEMSSVMPRAEPSETFLSWQDRVDIRGRSAILRPPPSDSTCAEDEAEKNCELEAGCLTRPSRRVVEQTLTFDSEVVAAYIFTIDGDDNGTLGLEAVAHAPPHLAPDPPPSGNVQFQKLLLYAGSPQALSRPLPWYNGPRLYAPLEADEARSFRSLQRPVHLPRHHKRNLDLAKTLANRLASRSVPNGSLPYSGRLPSWLNASKVRDELPESGIETQGSMPILTAIGIFALGMIFSGLASRSVTPLWLRVLGASFCEKAGLSPDWFRASEISEVSSQEVAAVDKTTAAELGPTQEVRADVDGVPPEIEQSGLVRRPDPEPEVTPTFAAKGSRFSLSLNSHFTSTFRDPKRIGVGGFGAVYEAEHKVLGESYAVKLIPINGLGDDEDVRLRWELCEVLNLRRLEDTRHVVRYFTCWYEEPQYLPFFLEDIRTGVASPKSVSPIIAPVSEAPVAEYPKAPFLELSDGPSELSNRFCQVAPHSGHDEGGSASGSCLISSLESNMSGDVLFERDSQGTHLQSISHAKPVGRKTGERAMSPKAGFDDQGRRLKAVLIIQMELCRGNTLRSWLDRSERSSALPMQFSCGREGEALELVFARQLMKGIRQIHDMDVVHRDLKPQNIFITQEDVLKIGDFGLSRHLKDRHKKEEGEVGTALYCAPEGGARATKPADIFSAALIILELLCPSFKTHMERVQVLGAFRDRGELPAHINQHHAAHAELLRAMAHRDPAGRPSAQEVHQRLKQLNLQTKLGASQQ